MRHSAELRAVSMAVCLVVCSVVLKAAHWAATTVVCWVDPTVAWSGTQRAVLLAQRWVAQKAAWTVGYLAVCSVVLKVVCSVATMVFRWVANLVVLTVDR